MNLVRDHELTRAADPRDPPDGLDAVAHAAAGIWRRRRLPVAALRRRAERVLEAAEAWRDLGDGRLTAEVARMRERFRRHRRSPNPGNRRAAEVDEAEEAALGLTVEAARRHLGLLAHPEQVMGAVAVRRGFLAEMATGEGKTLAIALAAVPHGWTRLPCHVVTANDYLAHRDAESLAPFFRSCGVRVGHVVGGMAFDERQAAYRADVVYTTAKEIVADFLRDRLRLGVLADPGRRLVRSLLQPGRRIAGQIVMRGLHTAIVDEADHAMIDEAVTPLIISRQTPNRDLVDASRTARMIAADLRAGRDYRVDRTFREIELNERGRERIAASAARLPGAWGGRTRSADLVSLALRAREFFHRDQQYVLADGKLVIVDESTGRLMDQRSWSEGLHQAVEAKEGLEITTPAETLARLSFQRFFRHFHHLSGLTGTGREAAGEFWRTYGLPVVTIPPHRPCRRRVLAERILPTSDARWEAVVAEILACHRRGQPVLVGTRSVAASEHLARLLEPHRVHFSVLNAKRHDQEAAIVALAGERGKITIATNMAGRGTDIRLGPGAAEMGGLHVIATERHESRRIDRQLVGRAARQGDPGSVRQFASLEDELVRRHLPDTLRRRLAATLKAGLPGAATLAGGAVRSAQALSERMACEQRRSVLRNDLRLEESLGFASES